MCAAPQLPSSNDREFDLLKKIVFNTARINAIPGGPYPEVLTFGVLPPADENDGVIYIVREGTGIPFINRDPAGLYRSDGASWELLADLPDDYFSNYVQDTRTVNGHALSADVTVTKSDVGLGNADNTSDVNKPVSTATASAISSAAAGKLDVGSTTAVIADSTNRRYVLDADLTKLGNLSGVNTGDQTTITGNAGTATALQTARNINGVPFDGTANITVTAAADAGTLTGTTLASGVTASSLTSAAGGSFGTAAFTASTAYATAAQGTTAEGAAQKASNLSDLTNSATARTNLRLQGLSIAFTRGAIQV